MLRRTFHAFAKLEPEYFVKALKRRGTTSFFGVPDSLLKGFSSYVADHSSPADHVIAANEGNAIAMAAGHYLATGTVPCVYMQSSGVGNTVNPILSMLHREVHCIPCLMVVGWHGQPLVDTGADPGHMAQGKLTEHCLTAMDVPYSILGESEDVCCSLDTALDKAYYHFGNDGTPYAILVENNTIAIYQQKSGGEGVQGLTMTREQALEQILRQLNDRDIVVSTTGEISRELFAIRQRMGVGHDRDFLTAGAMGHCSAVAVGVALAQPDRQVVCIDGDGSAVMHMGALAVNGGIAAVKNVHSGHGSLRNFKHIVLNNGAHDSEGGQPTAGFDVSLTGIARASAYFVVREDAAIEVGDLVNALSELRACDGPAFLEVFVKRGARPDLARPGIAPRGNRDAFMGFLSGAAGAFGMPRS